MKPTRLPSGAVALLATLLLSTCLEGPAGAAPDSAAPDSTVPEAKRPAMTVSSSGIVRGVIADAYGARGKMVDGVPVQSLPLKIANPPKGTVAYAVLMTDPDAEPVGGIVWRHWMAVNIKAAKGVIAAGAATAKKSAMVQGVSDYGTVGYGGPQPPDKTHKYVITVYALSGQVALAEGFDLSIAQFKAKVKSKTLAKRTIYGTYAP